MDERSYMVDVAKFFMEFLRNESCGKCTPCREGTTRMFEILSRVTERPVGDEILRLEWFWGILHLEELADIVRDPNKCILCGRCVTVCHTIQGVGAIDFTGRGYETRIDPSFYPGLNVSGCIFCGQCVRACPTGALSEKNQVEDVVKDLGDVDAVLTTRELKELLRRYGIKLNPRGERVPLDFPFAEATGAGRIFGATGGVMEAAIRTAYKLLVGSDLSGDPKIADARGLERVKIFSVEVGGAPLHFAVVNGLGEVRSLIEPVTRGSSNLHFLEVMTCLGGCIGGGGQPYDTDLEALKKRMRRIYEGDRKAKRRLSHENEQVQFLYEKYLGKPLGPMSHRLLHRTYTNRKKENRRFEEPPAETAGGEF